jgi:hypothetical protein
MTLANPDLRQACADIMRQRGCTGGADAIECAERLEYGDPVPADEHAEIVAELETRIEDAERDRDEALLGLKARSKALKNLEAAIVSWDDSRDDLALLAAWDEYRRASR